MTMTYDDFIATINSLTVRTDAPIPTFISLAEDSLRTVTKHYLAEKTVTLSVVDNTAELPSDFIELRSITGSHGYVYKPVNPAQATLYADEVGYYHSGNTLVFVGNYVESEVTILYWSAFEGLSPTQSNWLFDRFPTVYVAAVMKEFYRWEKDAEGVAIEQATLQELLGRVAEHDRRGRKTGNLYMGFGTWL
ncbi:hypothetical protein GOC06_07020 [Sinorhizobium meliloti]|nr:hypothetical protein [Sinorhizobium meliloti]MDX0370611.1 hypothetical protein [Sinorhizobium meliloti]